ncbi:Sec-independent protein translocase subunit TatA [Actinomadura sp. HBU206391]|uniref:Sec-independent protein translocase subunit TatA n=1 Tax=Actinomadura sp. HBU206391 TaxID=2731692 RepID=UPI00165004FB|nr:Sec-independent protein translocase subunit TatA [Actinomadura sp. HBU206391]MBC6463798.1 Sec-independent protein translocase subunit TatA [Actinomadura sp. HBU206391]
MPSIGTPEVLIILVVVLLLFGSAKLPQLARSLGKSARILKAETKGLRNDDDDDEQTTQQAKAQAAQAQSQAAQAQAEQAQNYQAPPQRQLPPGAGEAGTINGVPLSEAERSRRTS